MVRRQYTRSGKTLAGILRDFPRQPKLYPQCHDGGEEYLRRSELFGRARRSACADKPPKDPSTASTMKQATMLQVTSLIDTAEIDPLNTTGCPISPGDLVDSCRFFAWVHKHDDCETNVCDWKRSASSLEVVTSTCQHVYGIRWLCGRHCDAHGPTEGCVIQYESERETE